MLPNIPWLRPLGLLVVIAAERLPGGEMTDSKPSRYNTILFLIMAQVMLGLWQSDREQKRFSANDELFDVIIVLIWAWSLISEFRKRRAQK